MNRTTGKQFIRFGSQEITVPPVMIARDKEGKQKLIKTTTPQHHLKIYRGQPALNLISNNTPTRVEKISRTAIIETKEKQKRRPRQPKQLSENAAATRIQSAFRNDRAAIEMSKRLADKSANVIQEAIKAKIARNKVREQIASNAFSSNRSQTMQNMQRDIMVQGVINDLIDNVPEIKNDKNIILPNNLLIPAPRPKQQIVPKQTPKVKQQIVAKQAAVATTSTYDATRTYTREQLDAMSETQLRELLRSIMGSNFAPKKGKDPQVATDVYNAYQRNLTRKGRRLINERKQKASMTAPGATTANMIYSTNTIAQQLEELKQQSAVSILGAKFKRKLSENKNKAATKIQGAFKKLKAKNESKASSIRKLSRKRIRRLEDVQALNERLKLEQEALKRYSNDNPKKFVKMEIQIEKTIKQIEFYTKQINFLTEKIEK
jgi:hypothetical protein